eukprot:Sdes_comp20791_c0_seq1m16990
MVRRCQQILEQDCTHSRRDAWRLFAHIWNRYYCGAGIGRVTKRLLLPLFDEVDLVEQNSTFLERAKDYVCSDRAKNFYCSGLQDFTPEKGRYDLIWCQWVLGHLTDEDMIEFFQRCKSGLSSGGFICVKENLTKEGFLVDKDDNSVTR